MKRWIYIALICLFAVIFLVSGGFLIKYWVDSNAATEQYDDLAQMVEQGRQEIPTVDTDDPQTSLPDPFDQVTDPVTGETVPVLKEYSQLYLMNPDTVGWIRIDGTRIDYPVMQTPDNPDFYLKHDFYKASSGHGCIYAKEDCDLDAPSDNVVIYGHRMNDGSMFADLHKYKKQSFWQEHPHIQLDTLTQHRTYEIVSVFLISSTYSNPFQFHLFTDAYDQADFDKFISNCRANQLYDTGIIPQYGDKLITLSTCEYSNLNGRLVVVARQKQENP